jgi:hypothetical protein
MRKIGSSCLLLCPGERWDGWSVGIRLLRLIRFWKGGVWVQGRDGGVGIHVEGLGFFTITDDQSFFPDSSSYGVFHGWLISWDH